MHQEHYVSSTKIVAASLWVAVASLMLAAWILALLPMTSDKAAVLLAFTSCALAPAAAVAHIKVFAMKTTHLIRVVNGLPLEGPPAPPEGAGLTRIR